MSRYNNSDVIVSKINSLASRHKVRYSVDFEAKTIERFHRNKSMSVENFRNDASFFERLRNIKLFLVMFR